MNSNSKVVNIQGNGMRFQFEYPSLNMMFASPRSGKSYMCRFLIIELCKMGVFSSILVCSNNIFNGDYDFLPKHCLKSEFKETYIQQLVDYQSYLKERQINNVHACLILDDVLGSRDLNSNFMRNFITRFRHLNITVFITVQHCKAIPQIYRSCCSQSFIFEQFSQPQIRALREAFVYQCKNDNECAEFIRRYTNDYNVLLCYCNERLEKRYVKIKARDNFTYKKYNPRTQQYETYLVKIVF